MPTTPNPFIPPGAPAEHMHAGTQPPPPPPIGWPKTPADRAVFGSLALALVLVIAYIAPHCVRLFRRARNTEHN